MRLRTDGHSGAPYLESGSGLKSDLDRILNLRTKIGKVMRGKKNEYDIRKLALIRLYLGDDPSYGSASRFKDLKTSELFHEIGIAEFEKIVDFGLSWKDIVRLLDDAYEIYFGVGELQYAFDFNEDRPQDSHDRVIKILIGFLENREYTEGDLRGYSSFQSIYLMMTLLLDTYRLTFLRDNFQDFLSEHDTESHIDDRKLFAFYGSLIQAIQLDRDAPKGIVTSTEGVKSATRSILGS